MAAFRSSHAFRKSGMRLSEAANRPALIEAAPTTAHWLFQL
jgi:hypothetical protein